MIPDARIQLLTLKHPPGTPVEVASMLKRLIMIMILVLVLAGIILTGGVPDEKPETEEYHPLQPEQLNLLAILPLSGEGSAVGLAQQYGIEREVIVANDHSIKLFIEDSTGDPDHAEEILKYYQQSYDIHAIIISGCESVKAVAPGVARSRIPTAAIGALDRPASYDFFDTVIWFTMPVADEIETLTPFLKGYSDIAFIYPETGEGRERGDMIQSSLPGTRLRMIPYDPEDEEYILLIRPLLTRPPEIFIIYGDESVPAIISAIRSRGANPIILVWEDSGESLLQEAPHLAEGVFILAPATARDHPLFSEDHGVPSGMPAGIVAEAFDAAYTLSSRISFCMGDSECITGWYWNRPYEGARGQIHFNEKREVSGTYEIRQVRMGRSERVEEIAAPPRTVYITIDTGGSPGWFIDEVKRGVGAALNLIHTETMIALPFGMNSGIPSFFDAHVAVVYDTRAPRGATVIGHIGITPDGGGSVSGGAGLPGRDIGMCNEAYITRCFDLLDIHVQEREELQSISILSIPEDGKYVDTLRKIAASRGYTINTRVNTTDTGSIREAIETIQENNPKGPLFIYVSSPQEAIDVQYGIRNAGYTPGAIFTMGDAWKTGEFIRRTGVMSGGIMAGSVFRRESITENLAIRDVNSLMVRTTGREICDISARAFTGVLMAADAAERAGKSDPVSISYALETSDMTTEYGALYEGTTYIVQLKDGVYRTATVQLPQ